MNQQPSQKTILQLSKFSIVGVLNTFCDWAIYYLLLYFGIGYLVAQTISFCCGMINSYVWNHWWTFQHKQVTLFKLIAFLLVNIGSLGVRSICMFLLIEQLVISPKIAIVVVVIPTVLVNFLGNKYITFHEKR